MYKCQELRSNETVCLNQLYTRILISRCIIEHLIHAHSQQVNQPLMTTRPLIQADTIIKSTQEPTFNPLSGLIRYQLIYCYSHSRVVCLVATRFEYCIMLYYILGLSCLASFMLQGVLRCPSLAHLLQYTIALVGPCLIVLYVLFSI